MAIQKFFYWQKHGEDSWQVALSDDRDKVVATARPAFTTVLDLSTVVLDEMTQDEILGIRYSGPMYWDLDAPDIADSIAAVQRLVHKIEQQGVDIKSLHLFATGNRGFHILMPMSTLVKVPPKGVQYLPQIYKEIAYQLYVDTVDLVVYSARRSRMFRTCGDRTARL